MRSEHAWALLTARAIQYDRAPGGHAHMTQSDVAALLRGLERKPFLTAMLADCGDITVHHELYRHTERYVIDLAIAEGWKLHHPRMCQQMSLLAIFELVGARAPCAACEGKGSIPLEEGSPALVSCEPCRGSGREPLNVRDRATLVRIHESSWKRTWDQRYELVFSELHHWLTDARRHLARRLRKEDRKSA